MKPQNQQNQKKIVYQTQNQQRTGILFYVKDTNNQILYSQFKLKKQKNSQFQVLSDIILGDDCQSNIYTAARILVNQVCHFLSPAQFFQDESLINPNLNMNDEQIKNKKQNQNWLDLMKDPFYYDWISLFCDSYYWNSDDNELQVLLSPIKFQDLDKIKNFLNQNYNDYFDLEFFTEKQILEQNQSIFMKYIKEINFEQTINFYVDNEKKEYSKEKNIILFLNKPKGFEKFKQGVPFVHAEGIYKGVYKKKYENWQVYNVGKMEYPSDEVLKKTNCIIIPGASSSAQDEDKDWIVQLREKVKYWYCNIPDLKILGICFGEQIIAHSLGGLCENMQQRLKQPSFYKVGNENCFLEEEFWKTNLIKNCVQTSINDYEKIKQKGYLIIKEAHGDVVTKLPDKKYGNFHILSKSQDGIEIIIDEEERALGFQGHPEYHNIWHTQAMSAYFKILYQQDPFEAYEELMQKFNKQEQVDTVHLREICEIFMKTPLKQKN